MDESVDAEDIAYFAGLIDGEGTVNIKRLTTRRKGKVYVQYYAGLEISNTNKAMMDYVYQKFGGYRQTLDKEYLRKWTPNKQGNWRDEYRITFRKDEVLSILPKVLPYLIAKKKQAELVLQFLQVRNTDRATDSLGRFIRKPYSAEELAIVDQVRALNGRGLKVR